jgi:hypothetical protein
MTPLDVLDWRRRVHVLYAQVRASVDPAAAHDVWRRERDLLFASHPASPIPVERRADFGGLRYHDYDPALRFVAPIDAAVAPFRLEVTTGTDGVVPFERVGRVHLPVGDLDVWWLASYGGGLFVPLKDSTAGDLTYGGGRYLLDTAKGADLGRDPQTGGLVFDLNFAYNASCAYDSRWACPLAPVGNTVGTGIAAGELLPG